MHNLREFGSDSFEQNSLASLEKIDKNRATNVELNATPKLSVIPEMSPANASEAFDKAWPII